MISRLRKQDTGCNETNMEDVDERRVIIASNRGPVTFTQDLETGEFSFQRGGGGLVTAMLGMAADVDSVWIACAQTPSDSEWKKGDVALVEGGRTIHIKYITPEPDAYSGYYSVISNPLLWFLQHSIWDFSYAPTINRSTWTAWDEGYVVVNKMFADEILQSIKDSDYKSLVMLQDYHLYLAPQYIRSKLPRHSRVTLTQFIHIPWPGPEDWGMLPQRMREEILKGLCALDMIGMQTRADALNFIRTCESLLPGVRVNFKRGKIIYKGHTTHVRDFPISIDVEGICRQVETEEVSQYSSQLLEQTKQCQTIVRIDRIEPSKNIIRGFQAYSEMLESHSEHIGNVMFLALLVPSRLEVEEYQGYLNELMAVAGSINARFGTSEWEPIRVLVGESYPRALAALQMYDVLLVNPVADGMNLVAKEGPIVNSKNGVLVLSERAGASQQLGEYAMVVSPCDVSATADDLHAALVMPEDERQQRARLMRARIEREDIHLWLCWQLEEIRQLSL